MKSSRETAIGEGSKMPGKGFARVARLQSPSLVMSSGSDVQIPLIDVNKMENEYDNLNEVTCCIVRAEYSQFFMETDLYHPYEWRMINPTILNQIKVHWKQATECSGTHNKKSSLNILFFTPGDRDKEIERIICQRYHEHFIYQQQKQNKLVLWDIWYSCLFFLVSVLLMFAAGYVSEFWVAENSQIPNAVTVMATLVCTYAIQVCFLLFAKH